jgi:hypothetical protein
MSYNFDIFCMRVREKDHLDATAGLPIKSWRDCSPGIRDMFRERTRAVLKCLVEDGFDFGGLEKECELECD